LPLPASQRPRPTPAPPLENTDKASHPVYHNLIAAEQATLHYAKKNSSSQRPGSRSSRRMADKAFTAAAVYGSQPIAIGLVLSKDTTAQVCDGLFGND
jgi:hypothetical protein